MTWLATCSAAHAETVGNAGVIALHRAGLAGEAIAAKVRGGPCDYDTSTTGLIALRKADVPHAAILAVIERCNAVAVRTAAEARHAPGLFLVTADMREVALRPAAQASIKVTGNGSILFPRMARLVVPQAAAQATGGARPGFLFAFPASARAPEFGAFNAGEVVSPNEFSLVRFRVDGGNRLVTIGRVQPYVEISGVDPKNTLPFAVHDLGDGLFRVDMAQDLPPGQYGFITIGERERRKGTLFRIYDFGVGG